MRHLPLVDFTNAACKGMDTRLFVGTSNTAYALETCARCPVKGDCYEWALADPTLHGVWGATSKPERDAERLRRRMCMRCGARRPNRAHLSELCSDCRAQDGPVVVKVCDQCGEPLEGKERCGKRHQACACGTPSGPNLHFKRREPLCQQCRDWNTTRLRQMRGASIGRVAS